MGTCGKVALLGDDEVCMERMQHIRMKAVAAEFEMKLPPCRTGTAWIDGQAGYDWLAHDARPSGRSDASVPVGAGR